MYESPLPARPSLIKQRRLAILASLLALLALSSLGTIQSTGPGCLSALSDQPAGEAEWAFTQTTYGWPLAYLTVQRERPACRPAPTVTVVWHWLGVIVNLLLAGGLGAALYLALTTR